MFEKSDQPKTAICVVCKKELPTTTEYWYPRTDRPGNKVRLGKCRDCHRNYQRVWKQHCEDTPKPQMAYAEPYKYASKKQRVAVETFMRKVGWKKNEELGFWWKPGIRSEAGFWNEKVRNAQPMYTRIGMKYKKK